eukprot:165543_1
MAFRNINRLLYNSRIIGNHSKTQLQHKCLNRSLLQNNCKRSYSLFWQRVGIDWGRAKIRFTPLTHLERGGAYQFWVFGEYLFCGSFVWAFAAWFWQIQYVGHWVRSWEFFTLELQHDTYRDPLIPPPEVWTSQNKQFIEEIKIRNARFRKQQERLAPNNLVKEE